MYLKTHLGVIRSNRLINLSSQRIRMDVLVDDLTQEVDCHAHFNT